MLRGRGRLAVGRGRRPVGDGGSRRPLRSVRYRDVVADGPRSLVSNDVQRAVAALRSGGLVAIPTETVYGLAAAVTDRAAVRRIYSIKGRPGDHPVIVHLASAAQIDEWTVGRSPTADLLAATCWPGPLTVIVPRSDAVADEVTGGRSTVGVRVPAHPLTRQLIEALGEPLAAPSANRFGKVSPTSAAHVFHDLQDLLDPERDVILDGGDSDVGIESTIVDTTTDPPEILRPGGITAEEVARLLGGHVVSASGSAPGGARAPGMLPSHYAPQAEVRLARSRPDALAAARAVSESGRSVRLLDPTDDLPEAARHLYDDLRRADADGIEVVVAVLPPASGLGYAVRDRLTRAAHPAR